MTETREPGSKTEQCRLENMHRRKKKTGSYIIRERRLLFMIQEIMKPIVRKPIHADKRRKRKQVVTYYVRIQTFDRIIRQHGKQI